MSSQPLLKALQRYGSDLESACADACKKMWEEGGWDDEENKQGYDELWKLNDRCDADYDCPSIGVHYALWYHLQRTHHMVRALAPMLIEQSKRLAIYDAGCGTGATAWATAVLVSALREINGHIPEVTVFGKDRSQCMLDAGDSLWSALSDTLVVSVRYNPSLGKWRQPQIALNDFDDVLIVCSYLFSDSDLNGNKLKKSKKHLRHIWRSTGAGRMLTVSPRRKARRIEEATRFESWSVNNYSALQRVWNDPLSQLSTLRQQCLDSIGERSPYPPSWSENYGKGYDPVFRLYTR